VAPPTVDTILTIVLVVGLGAYFAWGVVVEAKRAIPKHKWLHRREALWLANLLAGGMIVVGLLQAWRYKTWQPVWVVAAIAVIMIVSVRFWAKGGK
jgi:cell division protein FtsW (lipid II flippase)